jgi:two-component system, NtrC family, response regulator GlrR
MKKPSILLVDDDAALRELITLRLEANGFRVESVDSGEAALGQLALSRPDAVLTDMQMAGMDGMALFKTIHARDPALPVIVLTAHGTIPDAVAATQQGLFGYLTKPYDAATLVDLLKRATRLTGSSPELGDDRLAQRNRHRKPDHGGIAGGSPAGRAKRGIVADPGRVGYRQGTAGARHPPRQPAT